MTTLQPLQHTKCQARCAQVNSRSQGSSVAWVIGCSFGEILSSRVRPASLQFQQTCFRVKSTCKPSELTSGADDAMTRHDDRQRIFSTGGAHSPCSLRSPELFGKIAIGSCLAKWYGEQLVPYLFLERSSLHVGRDREAPPLSREVLGDLPRCFDEKRMGFPLFNFAQTNAIRILPLPQHGDQSFVARDEFQFANR